MSHFYFYFWPCLWHVEVPRPGTKPAPQQQPKQCQSQHWQCQILNPLHHKGTPPMSHFFFCFTVFGDLSTIPFFIANPGVFDVFNLGSSRYLERIGSNSSSQKSSKKEQAPSGAELERQQILQEMRKRTSLYDDNSWIRQRSSSINKEPICLPGIMRRYETSLE